MKHTVLTLVLLAGFWSAGAQTAIYKHFADRPKVHAYCVERYPLYEGETVSVTLLTTADSSVYRSLRKELNAMKYTPHNPQLINPDDYSPSPKHGYPAKKPNLDTKKSLEIHTADALPGDKGWYIIFAPSDRMAFLIFLVGDEKEELSIIRHVTFTEFQ